MVSRLVQRYRPLRFALYGVVFNVAIIGMALGAVLINGGTVGGGETSNAMILLILYSIQLLLIAPIEIVFRPILDCFPHNLIGGPVLSTMSAGLLFAFVGLILDTWKMFVETKWEFTFLNYKLIIDLRPDRSDRPHSSSP